MRKAVRSCYKLNEIAGRQAPYTSLEELPMRTIIKAEANKDPLCRLAFQEFSSTPIANSALPEGTQEE